MADGKMKLWVGLGTFVLVAGAGGAALSGQDHSQHGASHSHTDHGAMPTASQGGEGGEGGEAGMTADPATDDVAYLTQLGMVRGHLNVGVTLYLEGARDAGRTHMKHPQDELYASLLPAFEARGVNGFDKELERLAELTAQDASDAEVSKAYEQLVDAITRTESKGAPTSFSDPLKLVEISARLMRAAGEEYDEGTEDRRVVMAHEYQDAWGFVQTAQLLIGRVEDKIRQRAPDTLKIIKDQFDTVSVAWTGVVPPERVDADPSLIHGAAAQLDFAAASLR